MAMLASRRTTGPALKQLISTPVLGPGGFSRQFGALHLFRIPIGLLADVIVVRQIGQN